MKFIGRYNFALVDEFKARRKRPAPGEGRDMHSVWLTVRISPPPPFLRGAEGGGPRVPGGLGAALPVRRQRLRQEVGQDERTGCLRLEHALPVQARTLPGRRGRQCCSRGSRRLRPVDSEGGTGFPGGSSPGMLSHLVTFGVSLYRPAKTCTRPKLCARAPATRCKGATPTRRPGPGAGLRRALQNKPNKITACSAGRPLARAAAPPRA